MLPDGGLSLCCEDSTARVVLRPGAGRFAACFPLLVDQNEPSQDSDAPCEFTYVWQTQTFSQSDFPTRWQHPLALLQEAAQQGIKPSDAADHPDSAAKDDSAGQCETQQGGSAEAQPTHSPLPDAGHAATADAGVTSEENSTTEEEEQKALVSSTSAAAHVLDCITHIPQAVTPVHESPNFFEEGTWWTDSDLDSFPQQVWTSAPIVLLAAHADLASQVAGVGPNTRTCIMAPH